MAPPLRFRCLPPILLAAALGLSSGGCSFHEIPSQPPPLADLEEPPMLHDEPEDEAARQALSKGGFTGLTVAEAGASLEELAEGSGGLLVTKVVENSPADAAGILEGDILLEASFPAGGQPAVPLRYESEWRKVELDARPGSTLRLIIDRAGAKNRSDVVVAERVRAAGRQPAERFREEQRAGVVLRTATEVEARAAGLGPGGGAVIVGLSRASPWRSAGLRFGDLVVEVDGKPVAHPQVLLDAIRDAADHPPLRLVCWRNRERFDVDAPVSRRAGAVHEFILPPLVDYESDRGTSELGFLLGLIKITNTPAAWELRLLWLIKFGGGDADRLQEVKQ